MRGKHDLVVIGGGPGGYVAAIRAAQLGLNVGLVEKEKRLGGTCLRVGCIPSKALLESSERYEQARTVAAAHGVKIGQLKLDLDAMMARKTKIVADLAKGIESLLKKNKITRYRGAGSFQNPNTVRVAGQDEVELEAPRVIIATGSTAATLPGVEPDGDRITSSTEALAYGSVPRRLVVIGAGAIGLELGSVWRRLGAEVTVLEYLDRILPGMDGEIAAYALKVFKKQGLSFRLGCRVTSARVKGGKIVVTRDGQDPVEADRLLVAVGRKPNTEGLELERIGICPDDKGFIPVNEHFETSAEGVYAVGDVIRGPMLAHKAEEEGIACVERIVTGYGHVNYEAIPNIVYTHPEVASVGKTEEDLQQSAVAYRKGIFPFVANGRARTLGETQGITKVLADAQSDRLLGVHVFGPRAGDLVAEAACAIAFAASAEDLARACHAHPTLSEALKEAALGVAGRAIHF